MAGLGEACSHIAAVLFTLEANTTVNKNTSCTSQPCSWLPLTFQNVSYSELSNIDSSTPQAKRKKTNSCNTTPCRPSVCKQKLGVNTPTEKELDTFFENLSKVGKPVILSITPKFSESFVPMCVKGMVPEPLTDLYDQSIWSYHIHNFSISVKLSLKTIPLLLKWQKNIEKHTQSQSQSKLWFQQRAGRVTASKLKAAVCTDMSQPSINVINKICLLP